MPVSRVDVALGGPGCRAGLSAAQTRSGGEGASQICWCGWKPTGKEHEEAGDTVCRVRGDASGDLPKLPPTGAGVRVAGRLRLSAAACRVRESAPGPTNSSRSRRPHPRRQRLGLARRLASRGRGEQVGGLLAGLAHRSSLAAERAPRPILPRAAVTAAGQSHWLFQPTRQQGDLQPHSFDFPQDGGWFLVPLQNQSRAAVTAIRLRPKPPAQADHLPNALGPEEADRRHDAEDGERHDGGEHHHRDPAAPPRKISATCRHKDGSSSGPNSPGPVHAPAASRIFRSSAFMTLPVS